jgi:hypothetical protein
MENMEDNHERTTQPLPLHRDLTEDTVVATSMPSGEASRWEESEEQPTIQETIKGRPFGGVTPDQDKITTPVPLTPPPEAAWAEPQAGKITGTLRARSSFALRAVVALCLVLSLLSLAVNAFLVYSLMNARQTAVEGLDAAMAALDNFGGKGFHYDYRFEKTIPVSASIPIKQDLVFPFQGNFPINTTVKVPVDAGVLGKFVVEVPINTSVPVSVSIPIHVDQTFNVSTTFPVSMTIPVDVKPDDPEIQRLLGGVREWLVRLRGLFY